MPAHLLALGAITLLAAIVNGALGYGFSSITVPLALLFMTNRVLNPALVPLEVALNAYVLWVNRESLPNVWRRVLPIVIGLAPCSSHAFLMAGLETILLISLLSFSTIAGGVPAGAMKPTHKVAWKPFTPASSSVGTSGRMAERFLPVVAMARTNPAWIIGAMVGTESNSI